MSRHRKGGEKPALQFGCIPAFVTNVSALKAESGPGACGSKHDESGSATSLGQDDALKTDRGWCM
eukprot:9566504-Heterocapsa_arctica.AAC.1